MQAKPQCVSCIFNQALRVCTTLKIDEQETKRILDLVGGRIKDFDLSQSPPAIAVWVYDLIAKELGRTDLYQKQKKQATIHASVALQHLRTKEAHTNDLLFFALKSAVLGNVIDLAAQHEYDLQEEMEQVFLNPFSTDDFMEFKDRFARAKSVLIIGDNAGEHIFDAYMFELFGRLDPSKKYYYAARSAPIINDLTYKEALDSPLAEVCTVVDSGVDTPGLELDRADDAFLQLLAQADLVIAKGMGNYESMAAKAGREVFHLMKIKCDVVSADFGKKAGSIVFAKI